ncbi:Hypothetical predicted protein [Cloeon dipterum]|uniref:RING-type domain-containing protein n=1 Tax=Cloeon dipterum TaxID=197152 RepID=A0A8S1CLH0_9INSE|nr:Hypothetical predicted protein [Cloeon dipterum]
MENFRTEGLSERAKQVLLSHSLNTATLMTLNKKELAKALRLNHVRCKSCWSKFTVAQRLRSFIRERQIADEHDVADQEPAAGRKCMVCQELEATFAFSLCMHVGVCEECMRTMVDMERGGPVRCPFCRAHHFEEDIKRLFFVGP